MPSLLDTLAQTIRAASFVAIKARARIIYMAIVVADPSDRGVTYRQIQEFTGLSNDTIRAGVDDLVRAGRATLVKPYSRDAGRGRAPWSIHVHEATSGKFASVNEDRHTRSLFNDRA